VKEFDNLLTKLDEFIDYITPSGVMQDKLDALIEARLHHKATQNTTELDLANVIDSRTFTVGNTQNKVDAIMQLLNGGNCERAK